MDIKTSWIVGYKFGVHLLCVLCMVACCCLGVLVMVKGLQEPPDFWCLHASILPVAAHFDTLLDVGALFGSLVWTLGALLVQQCKSMNCMPSHTSMRFCGYIPIIVVWPRQLLIPP